MTTFYCVRHGKTEFNLNKIFQGGLADSPLLPEGIDNAKKAGNYLKDISFDGIFVSPQKRAQDTAQNIISSFESPLSIQTIEDLREMEFGEWDGHPEENYHHMEEFQNLVHRPHLYDPSEFGGETFQTMIDRSIAVFDSISQQFPNGTVLIVSHGLTLQSTLKYLDGSSIEEIRQGRFLDNTSVTILEKETASEKYKITKWNDTTHLM